MKQVILSFGIIGLTAFGFACSTTTSNANSNPNSNVATVTNTTNALPANANAVISSNPITNVAPPPAQNGVIPGIPNSTAADVKSAKQDPTRNAKTQNTGVAAPDNSEVTTSFAQDYTETRVFNNNAQIAKVVRTTDSASKKIVKVYFRNGQVKEIEDGKLPDAMKDSAADIIKAASNAKTAAPDAKPTSVEKSEIPVETVPTNPRDRVKRLQKSQQTDDTKTVPNAPQK